MVKSNRRVTAIAVRRYLYLDESFILHSSDLSSYGCAEVNSTSKSYASHGHFGPLLALFCDTGWTSGHIVSAAVVLSRCTCAVPIHTTRKLNNCFHRSDRGLRMLDL